MYFLQSEKNNLLAAKDMSYNKETYAIEKESDRER
jgi:hypothetical protein